MTEAGWLLELIVLIEKAVQVLPEPLRSQALRELEMLKEVLVQSRAPRLMVIGRRGAGKSSLINAIFDEKVAPIGSVKGTTGQGVWYAYTGSRGTLEFLDTRGLGDGTRPESANFQEALAEIKSAVSSVCPDTVLFLCKAKEVDSRIAEDVRNVLDIQGYVFRRHKYQMPVVGVVTHVDELTPVRVEPPYDDEVKRENIRTAVETMGSALSEANVELVTVMPVSALAEYDSSEVLTYKRYWNIDKLVEYLTDALPLSAQLQMARVARVRVAQRRMARTFIGMTATLCGAIAATPIPVADIIPITSAQVAMIIAIGYVSGRTVSRTSAVEFLGAMGVNVGVAVGLREAARALIKFVFPGAGNVVSAGVASAGTWALGEAAIGYFIEGKPIDEVKSIFSRRRIAEA